MTTSTPPIINDVDEVKAFDPNLWINKTRTYPRDPPLFIAEARRDAFSIPENHIGLLPAADLSVAKFVKIWFPDQSTTDPLLKMDLWFSNAPPTADLALLYTRPIPCPRTLTLLHSLSGQKWFDGALSIRDPRVGSTDCFPLAALEFWKALADIKSKHSIWLRAVACVADTSNAPPQDTLSQALSYACTLLRELPWNAKIVLYGVSTTTADLARLIGDTRLSDATMDVILAFLNSKLEGNPYNASTKAIGSIATTQELLRAYSLQDYSKTHALDGFRARLAPGRDRSRLRDLYLPAFVNGGHWIIIHIDFEKRFIEYGDSLELHQAPTTELDAVNAWLCTFSHRKFAVRGGTLAHGVQKDSHSCGIYAANMIGHAIHGADLLCQDEVATQRVRWFAAFVNECVNISLDSRRDGFTRPVQSLSSSTQADKSASRTLPPSRPPSNTALSSPASSAPATPLHPFFTGKRAAVLETEDRPAKRVKTSDSQHSHTFSTRRSAATDRANRDAWKDGTFTVSPVKLASWKAKILATDPGVEFKADNPVEAKCSKCRRFIKAKQPYDAKRFHDHYERCKGTNVMTLEDMATSHGFGFINFASAQTARADQREQTTLEARELRPCPGLTGHDDQRIFDYLQRCGAVGGGGRSLPTLATERYGKTYRLLKSEQKAIIDDIYYASLSWRNDQRRGRVFSTACLTEVSTLRHSAASPCTSCAALFLNSEFGRALDRNPAPDKNLIYTNKRFQDPVLGTLFLKTSGLRELVIAKEQGNPYIRYALGVAEGKYRDNKVLSGIMLSQLTAVDKEARGVGKQNFHWPEAYDRFLHIIRIESPQAYRTLSQYLPARSSRSFQMIESKEPAIPMSLCDRTYDLVKERLDALEYSGPVALACDDTKLLPAWRLWWSSDEKSYFLVGAVGDPLQVTDPELLQKTIDDAHATQATKVRVYTIQVPLPRVAPIIVAALPISDSMDGAALYAITEPILHGLLKRGVHIASLSSDGAKAERAQQKLLKNAAAQKATYSIPGPRQNSALTLTVEVPIIEGHPVVECQDSLHNGKTGRNNLFSGARLLTFGNMTMMFRRIWKLAHDPDSPLFRRDVNNVDHQDDNAAARGYSSETAHQLVTRHPDASGETVYLYLYGETTDAYQNRHIPHSDRLRMVLRAFYFVRMWQAYLRNTGYSQARYCISAEALAILRIIVEGLYALIIVYRDYYCRHGPFPLLPWLHSSEPVEHTFGCARQERPDFTMLDFYDMMKKIKFRMAESVSLGKVINANATASGYTHTYYDVRDINLHALSTYPSDSEISQIALAALEDAEALVTVFGIVPNRLWSASTTLPYTVGEQAQDTEDDSATDDELDEVDIACELSHLLHDEQAHWELHSTLQQDEHVRNLSLATAALTLDDIISNSYDDVDPETERDLCDRERISVRDALMQSALPAVPTPAQSFAGFPIAPSSSDIDLSYLVEQRRLHETQRTKDSVRRGSHQSSTHDVTASEHEVFTGRKETPRMKLAREIYAALREIQGPGGSVAKSRLARWCESVPGQTSGNSANAAAVAGTAAKNAVKKRETVFETVNFRNPLLASLISAHVTPLRPLMIDDFGFVHTKEHGLFVGKVLSIFTKGGGKNGRHGYIEDTSTVGAISYVSLQVYEYRFQRQFGAVTSRTFRYFTKEFAHLPSYAFLCMLSTAPQDHGNDIIIGQTDYEIFQNLQKGEVELQEAWKLFRKRGRKAAQAAVADNDGDDSGDIE